VPDGAVEANGCVGQYLGLSRPSCARQFWVFLSCCAVCSCFDCCFPRLFDRFPFDGAVRRERYCPTGSSKLHRSAKIVSWSSGDSAGLVKDRQSERRRRADGALAIEALNMENRECGRS